jgi:hypothetical protein
MFQSIALVVVIAVLGMFFTGQIRPGDISFASASGQNFIYLLALPYVVLMLMILKLDRD